jgi:predicted nucleic acid-binding protein
VLRRQLKAITLDARSAQLALTGLAALPARRAPLGPFLPRCWELRDNLTIYDATYVALAELLNTALLTDNQKIGRPQDLSAHRDPSAVLI